MQSKNNFSVLLISGFCTKLIATEPRTYDIGMGPDISFYSRFTIIMLGKLHVVLILNGLRYRKIRIYKTDGNFRPDKIK